MLELRIARKAFLTPGGAPRVILRDVAVAARPGDVLALVGPSGIGKSTVLRIALGLDREFDGYAEPLVGRIGVMFQEPRLLPWLTVAENLRLVRPPRRPQPDIEALLASALLPPQTSRLMPGELSLGMARRVAFARALAVDPEALVLDEPFASLDQGLSAALRARIRERAQRDRMFVLFSTHDLDAALELAHRVLVLAGDPATLAADLVVPPRSGLTGFRADLLLRFPFLGRRDVAGPAELLENE